MMLTFVGLGVVPFVSVALEEKYHSQAPRRRASSCQDNETFGMMETVAGRETWTTCQKWYALYSAMVSYLKQSACRICFSLLELLGVGSNVLRNLLGSEHL